MCIIERIPNCWEGGKGEQRNSGFRIDNETEVTSFIITMEYLHLKGVGWTSKNSFSFLCDWIIFRSVWV